MRKIFKNAVIFLKIRIFKNESHIRNSGGQNYQKSCFVVIFETKFFFRKKIRKGVPFFEDSKKQIFSSRNSTGSCTILKQVPF